MAYGFISYNSDDEVVINDTQPTYTRARTGTLSGSSMTFSGFSNNLSTYGYSLSGNAVLSGDELILFELGSGDWLCGCDFPLSDTPVNFISNSSTLGYSVFAPRDSLASPTGYGMAIFNGSGDCMWDSTTLLSRVENSAVLPESTFPSGPTVGYTSSQFSFNGGAFAEGGALYGRFNVAEAYTFWGHVIEAVSSTQARVTYKKLFENGDSSKFNPVSFRYPIAMTYLTGST